jgi:hypothetical protein
MGDTNFQPLVKIANVFSLGKIKFGECLLPFSLSSSLLHTTIKDLKIITLQMVLYGSENWSLTLREEHLTVFENRVLRRIFGPEREEVTGGWRKFHSEELHNLACTFHQIPL